MNKVLNIALAVWLGVALTGCAKNDMIIEEPSLPEGAIGFSDGVLTRGTPIVNADGVLSMGVFCGMTDGNFVAGTSLPANFMNNVNVSRANSSAAFTYSPLMYYPDVSTNKKLSFFAYAPHSGTLPQNTLTFSTTGGTPSLTYAVPTDVTQQPDLMVAAPQIDKTKSATPIAFAMKHTLAAIGFNIKGQGEKVTAIKIKGITTTATLAMDGSGTINWTNLSSPSTIEYTVGTTSDATADGTLTNIMNGDGYLMMIPQTLGADAKIIVTIDGEDEEVSLSGKAWIAGGKYMYDLTITPGDTGIIIGMFGGWNGTEYTKLLEVESVKTANDPFLAWANATEVTNATDRVYGVTNVNTLLALSPDLSAYPAAKYCNDKGEGWYLPSQNQLMAIWVAHGGIPAEFSFDSNYYWSATESNSTGSWYVNFGSGITGSNGSKTGTNFKVRCVRDVTP